MKKMHKIISFSAAIVLVSGVTATAALPVNPFSQIKSQIGSFVFGTKKNDKKAVAQQNACLHDALIAYRASLKDGRDKYVSFSKDLRVGYMAAVGQAATDLRNVNSSDKTLKNEKKKELSATRSAAVKSWSDKLATARMDWNKAQRAALLAYRAARNECFGQNANVNSNTNENVNNNLNINGNLNTNNNANANENDNINANENANANTNVNVNANANENINVNSNANANENLNTNGNANLNVNENTNANGNVNTNLNTNSNTNANTNQ
jgi:hypothetical protein